MTAILRIGRFPIRGSAHLAAIALEEPDAKRRVGFISRAMAFGAVAALLRYNVSRRILDEAVNRFLDIPPISFFDNFGPLTPSFPPPWRS